MLLSGAFNNFYWAGEDSLAQQSLNTYLKSTVETLEKEKNCLNLPIKTPDRVKWHRSDVFLVNFEHTSHLFLVFLLVTLNR